MISHNWNYLCLKRDVQRTHFKTFEMFGAQLIMTIGNEGKTVVARNQCSHRGFMVCEGSGKAEGLRCPYHGLPFNFPQKFLVHESGEAVFFGMPTPDVVKPMFTPVLGEEFASYRLGVKAPFHLWMQNTMDANHLATVHPKTFSRLFKDATPHGQVFEDAYSAYMIDVADDVREKYARYADPDSPFFDHGFMHMAFYPHLSVTSFLGIFFSVETAIPDPQDESYTSVYTRFFVAPNSKVPEALKNMAFRNNKEILHEDQVVVEHWARNYTNSAGFWLPGEERIKHYLDWCTRMGIFR